MGKKKGKGKHVSSSPVFVPIRHPQTMQGEMKRIKEQLTEQRNKDSNDTLNLIASAFLIVLKEFYEIGEEQLKDILNKVFEQLELCSEEVVTIDQMMDLCSSYGLEIHQSKDVMQKIGFMMQEKLKIYELLDQGITEIEDLHKKTGITSRYCSAFRWQWNKEKFGKDYEGDTVMASKKELAYKFFDEGVMDDNRIAKEIDSTKSSVATYKRDWKKEVLEDLTPEEASPYFAGEKELWEIKQEKQCAPKTKDKTEEVIVQKEEVTAQEEAAPETEEKEVVTATKRKGLKKVVQVISIEGDMATYKPGGLGCIDIDLGGQVLTLTKEEMRVFAEELLEVSEEEL